jgi:hypothetical protein
VNLNGYTPITYAITPEWSSATFTLTHKVFSCHSLRVLRQKVVRDKEVIMNVVYRRAVVNIGLLALGVSLFLPLNIRADAFVYHFTEVFSGAGPSGTAPWADALFEDISAGTVRLTITNVGLIDPESSKEFYFNLDPSLNPTSLSFTLISSSGSFDAPIISTGANEFKADGDGKYDILFAFTPGNVANNVFGPGEAVVYEISGIASLDVNDFIFLSSPNGGHGPFYAAAHVQNTAGGNDSGWIAPLEASEPSPSIPEPSSLALLSFALTFWAGRRTALKKA